MEVERSIWLRKKTNKLQVHPYKPVSWLPTHQRIYIYINEGVRPVAWQQCKHSLFDVREREGC